MKFLSAVALSTYALDQATKWWIYHHFALIPTQVNVEKFPNVIEKTAELPASFDVIPGWFQIVHWANTGAAFSLGTNNNGFFILLSLAAFIGIIIAYKRGAFADRLSRWGAALLLGGILGNVTDRLVHGYVVDFLLFDLHVPWANPWPAFNVADSAICCAVGLFLIASFRSERKKSGS
jgi:signal peptidase II